MGDFSLNRSNRVRLSRFLQGEDVILRGVSALKYMELFVEDHFTFDVEKERIFVYAKQAMINGNFDVKIVPDFTGIDYNSEWDISCSTLSQVVHDMLEEPELMNRSALVESLANYCEDGGDLNDIEVGEDKKDELECLKSEALSFY